MWDCSPLEPAAPPPPVEPATAPVEDPGPPRRGGTLRLWKPVQDTGLDPGIFHLYNQDVVYPTFTQPYTYQPTKNLFAMDGMVAYEQVDPTTLTWSIRPGMEFHNGDPVNSEAVVFSFSRLGKLQDVLGGTHVPSSIFRSVDRFEAPDDLTVTEHWRLPDPDILVRRAGHYSSFVNPRVAEELGEREGTYIRSDGTAEDIYSIQDLPFGSGSGPYVLARRDEWGTRVERWSGYHQHQPADDGFTKDGPYIDAWETRVIPDRTAAKSAFLEGGLDVYAAVDPLELAEFRGVPNVTVTELPGGGFSSVGMDGGKFHDKRARMALQKAIDYNRFLQEIRPAGGKLAAPISDLLPGFQKLSQEDLASWYRYDPYQARALWDAADFVVPVEKMTILQLAGFPLLRQIGEFLARSLAATLCIEIEVDSVDPGTWASRALDRGGNLKDWDLLTYGLGQSGGVMGLPGAYYLQHYDPRSYGFNAFNHHIDSPRPEIREDAIALLRMLNRQEQEIDPEARADVLTDIQRWILDRHWCNWALPVDRVSYFGFSSRLRDFGADDWLNGYDRRRESMWLADAGEEGS